MKLKAYSFFVALTILFFRSYSQSNINGLIAAEKSFAAYAIANNTKDAFLKNIDSTAVYLDKDGNSINGFEHWSKAEKSSAKLNWMPEYAEISSSGDFGYTTGPWYLYQKLLSGKPAARGHFITIWHLNNNNEWKFLLDLGVSYQSSSTPKTTAAVGTKVNRKSVDNTPVDIVSIDKAFIQLFLQSPSTAYRKYLSKNARLNKSDVLPAVNTTNKNRYITSIPAGLTFSPLGSFTSHANDLSVVYGNTIINGKKEPYLRIWRKEKHGWKIALEVLHY